MEELEKRLRSTLSFDCTWDDFLGGDLHIDHIRPIRSFRFSSPDDAEFKECWALSNLRLIPAHQNLVKGDSMEEYMDILIGRIS